MAALLDEADVVVAQESLGRGCLEEEEVDLARMTLLGEVSTIGISVRKCSDELSVRLAHVFSRWDGLWHTLLFPKAETCIRHAACSLPLNLV